MSRQGRPKQIQNSNFQMFKTARLFMEYHFLCFGHLSFRDSVIARPGATEAGECHRKKNPVWARVSNFDLPAIARDAGT
jgi:hypothetical protein